MINRVNVQKISITRAEGPVESTPETVEADSFKRIDIQLFEWSKTAPKGGAYDKCDFTVTFEDGTEYNGRYDLKHFTETQDEGSVINLAKRIRDHLKVTSLVERPSHFSDDEWKRYKDFIQSKGFDQEASEFINNYNI